MRRLSSPTPALMLLAAGLLMAALLPVRPAQAQEEAFSTQRLAALQEQGATVLVDVYADWCPTCRRQAEVLAPLLADPAYGQVVKLKLDFDIQKDLARALGATRQSTLILYRGHDEIGRSVAQTRPSVLASFLEPARAGVAGDPKAP